MKTLIVYPHGLGDCILATPAIREYKKQTGNFIGFAMLERFKSSELFMHNQYIDELLYTKDAWNDFSSYEIGLDSVNNFCMKIAKEKKYDKIILIRHSPNGSKTLDCAKALDIELTDFHTEIYTSDKDKEIADNLLNILDIDYPFGFAHSRTGVKSKDIPDEYAEQWLKKHGMQSVVEIDISYYHLAYPVNVGFEIMKKAEKICVADSVYYHAACAIDKQIDFVYFAKGKSVFNRVKPLHFVKQNVKYKI